MTSHAGSQSVDKYRTPNQVIPKTEADKIRYLEIWERYSQGALTQDQVAREFKLSRQHVTNIIKWAVHYLDEIDPIDAEKERRAIIDRSKRRIQNLDEDLNNAHVAKDRAYLYREARMNDHLIGKASGALNDNKVNIDNRKIQVITNVNRRRRGKTIEVDAEDVKEETGAPEQNAPEGAAEPVEERTDTDHNDEG